MRGAQHPAAQDRRPGERYPVGLPDGPGRGRRAGRPEPATESIKQPYGRAGISQDMPAFCVKKAWRTERCAGCIELLYGALKKRGGLPDLEVAGGGELSIYRNYEHCEEIAKNAYSQPFYWNNMKKRDRR